MNLDPAVLARLHNLYWALAAIGFIGLGSVILGFLAQTIVRWRGGTLTLQRRAFWGYLFAAPWLLGFVIFVVGPALASLYYSFTDYRLGRELNWVGLENYRILIEGIGAHGRRFMQSMYNSAYYALVGVPLQIITALGMAMLVARPTPGIGIFRLIFYLPVILAGGPAILLAWRYMLASNGGFVNITLASVAQAIPGAGFLYRSFIYVTESFNAFYAGISRADPVGALSFVLPSLAGAGLFAYFATGPLNQARRTVAQRAVELIGAGLAVLLLGRGIVAERIDPATWLGLALLGPASLRLALHGRLSGPARRALALAAAAIATALLGRLLLLEAQQLGNLGPLLVLRTPMENVSDLDYLRTVFPASLPSAAWLWGAVAALSAPIIFVDQGGRGRRLAYGTASLIFGLLALGSFLDGLRYFAAFAQVAALTEATVHHFALFRQVTAGFPDLLRVPLWLQSELWSKPSLVLITMWSSGAGMLIFLAALKGVPRSLYEAAEVDGAGPVQRFFRITLPMISPALFYNMVIGLIAALQTFEAVYIIQTPSTEGSLASAAYFLFVRTFRQLEIGQGAAASWILAVIIVMLTFFQFRYSRWVHYEA